LEEMPVSGVYISENKTEQSQVCQQFSETVKKNQVPVYTIRAGDTAMLSNQMKIECLSPYPSNFMVDTNENSLILRLVRGEHEILLMGDAGFFEEEVILNKNILISADVLKVGHHGSRNGTGEKWLQAVAPQYAVLSYGRGNRYGHPHIETIKRLQKLKINLLDTDRQGNITMKTNGKELLINTAVEGRKP